MRPRFFVLFFTVIFVLAAMTYAQQRGGGGQRGAAPAAGAAGAQQPGQQPAQGQRGAQPAQAQQGGGGGRGNNPPTILGPPAGMQALPTDLFTSKNFYSDKALWTDKRYFRCNTPRQITDIWTSGRVGTGPPASASWGNCDTDYPREKILSPLPYKTAKEHYDALMAAAKAKGGPTQYTKATVPDWDGYYGRDGSFGNQQWTWGTINQVPTILSVLTPEFQTRMVQQNYHEGVNNSPQWMASLCYPEGFMRWWSAASQGGNFQLIMNLNQVQFLSGIADNFLRQVHINKQHVQQVPQWFGEMIGFWDGETLITWTANIQGWTISHSMFEYSDSLETVETYAAVKDANGAFVGLQHEAYFYDPVAFAAPLHLSMKFNRAAGLNDPNRRRTHIQCLSNIRNVNGKPSQTTDADSRFIDYYGRPWAQNWEKYFETGWEKPEDDLPAGIFDIFNKE